MTPAYEETRTLFASHGQEHVLSGWDTLSEIQRKKLLTECARIDFDWLAKRWNEFLAAETESASAMRIDSAPVERLPAAETDKTRWAEAKAVGEEKIRRGAVAAFLVAGGQGTRLGFAGPKGCYPIGPLSGKTLFQWHAEQILARSRRYNTSIPWYVMTSEENDNDTRSFFEKNAFFGLSRNDVFFFRQEMVPCLDLNGKLMLSSPCSLAMNPNGHGGSLSGLRRSGALADMQKRGIEILSYFQVDNPLTTICDPVFIGWHVKSGSEMSSKVLEKISPEEKMGVVCKKDGKPAIVEYIDMDNATMHALDSSGKLKFWAGSIAIHMINADFVDSVSSEGKLPWHRSKKKVAYYDGNRLTTPETENAIKFETFVFDALPFARASLNLEVKREHEFAPLKNATGNDSIASCRELLSGYFAEWLARAGVTATNRPVVEISPLYALDAEELASRIVPEEMCIEQELLLA